MRIDKALLPLLSNARLGCDWLDIRAVGADSYRNSRAAARLPSCAVGGPLAAVGVAGRDARLVGVEAGLGQRLRDSEAAQWPVRDVEHHVRDAVVARLRQIALFERLVQAPASGDERVAVVIVIVIEGEPAQPTGARTEAEEDDRARAALHEHAIGAQHAGIDIDEPSVAFPGLPPSLSPCRGEAMIAQTMNLVKSEFGSDQ